MMKKVLLVKAVTIRLLLKGTAFFVACRISKGVSAQTRSIRVVTYNIEDDINGATTNYLVNGSATNIPARYSRIRLAP